MHPHWGCTAILQLVIIGTGIATITLASYCFDWDIEWNAELITESRVFSQAEIDILLRNDPALEIIFILLVVIATIASGIHLVLCFVIQKDKYRIKYHSIIILLLSVIYFVASPFIIASAIRYDYKYFEIEAIDNRAYFLRFQVNETEVREPSTKSPFYYCHMGYGKPRRKKELRGLRIRTTGSHLCQLVGLKIVAGILAVYMGILCILTKWQAVAHERFVNAKAVKQLFELYGDSEEYEYEHLHSESIAEVFKLENADHDEEGIIVVPTSAKHVRRKGLDIKDSNVTRGITAAREGGLTHPK